MSCPVLLAGHRLRMVRIMKAYLKNAGKSMTSSAHPGLWILLGVLLAGPSAMAETLYVTDILRLGLHNNQDTSDKPFKVLVSGDVLEVLERTTFYVRVRTQDGEEGWVKTSYLVEEKPSQTRLVELTSERDNLSAELTTARARLSQQESDVTSLRAERDELKQNATAALGEVSTLRAEHQSLSQQLDAKRFSIPVKWLALTALVTLVGGFLGGWWWTDARQRARHGGYRI